MPRLVSLLIVFTALSAHAAPVFEERALTSPAFRSVRLWAPPEGVPATDIVLLLHGNQGDAPDASWMANLRYYPAFASQILLAPGLPKGDFRWERPATLAALAKLVDGLASENPGAHVWVLGYSAGATRTLAVARALHQHPSGIVALAGDIAKGVRDHVPLNGLNDVPVLLVCNTGDRGPNGSCALDKRNVTLLQKSGFRRVSRETIQGDHNFHAAELGPLFSSWRAQTATLAHAN